MLMSSYLASRMFKPVPGGHVFQPPPATIFQRTSSYLVDENKRTEIIRVLNRGEPRNTVIVLAAALALAAITGGLVDRLHAPVWAILFLAFCAFLLAFLSGAAFEIYLRQRQLRLILTGLPRSEEVLFPHPKWSALPKPRPAAVMCGVTGLILGYQSAHHLPFTTWSATMWLFAFAFALFSALRPQPEQSGGRRAHREIN